MVANQGKRTVFGELSVEYRFLTRDMTKYA